MLKFSIHHLYKTSFCIDYTKMSKVQSFFKSMPSQISLLVSTRSSLSIIQCFQTQQTATLNLVKESVLNVEQWHSNIATVEMNTTIVDNAKHNGGIVCKTNDSFGLQVMTLVSIILFVIRVLIEI